MKRKFWNWVKNEGEEARTLYLSGEISDETWFGDEVTPKMFKDELMAGSGDITLWINSPGGDVFAAAQIYNMLMDYPSRVTVKIDGLAASAASVIAMAGSQVEMSPVAMMMIHNPITVEMEGVKDASAAKEVVEKYKALEAKKKQLKADGKDTAEVEAQLNALEADYTKAKDLADTFAQATGVGSIAVGKSSQATEVNAIAIGNGATVSTEGGVALGSGSKADIGKGEYGADPLRVLGDSASTNPLRETPAWKSTASAVSVGNVKYDEKGNITSDSITRQITGVAAGTKPTDAVNVAQLTGSSIHYYSVSDVKPAGGDGQTAGGSNYDNKGAVGAGSLAAGFYANANGEEATAFGYNSQSTEKSGSSLGSMSKAMAVNATAVGHSAEAIGTDATATGSGSLAKGSNSVATGYSAQALKSNSSAYGVDSVAAGTNSSAVGLKAEAFGRGAIAIGHETTSGALVKVIQEKGTSGTDAIYTTEVITQKDKEGNEYVFLNMAATDDQNSGSGENSGNQGAVSPNSVRPFAAGGKLLGDGISLKADTKDDTAATDEATKTIVVAYNAANDKYYAASSDGKGGYKIDFTKEVKPSEENLNRGGITIGSYAHAEGDRSLALGRASGSYGKNSSAIGIYANAVGDGDLALGHGASTGVAAKIVPSGKEGTAEWADGFWTTEINKDTNGNPIANTATGGIAIGSYSHTEGTRALAVGRVASAYGMNSTAIGLRSSAYGEGSIAFGHGVVAGNEKEKDVTQLTELHNNPKLKNNQGLPYDLDGKDNIKVDPTKVVGAVAIGSYAEATGRGSLSVGRYSQAKSAYSTTLGIRANVLDSAENAIAIGREAEVGALTTGRQYGGLNSIAIGTMTKVNGQNSIAIGMADMLNKKGTEIVGVSDRKATTVTGDKSIAIGMNDTVVGNSSIAIGTGHQVGGNNSGAIGDPNVVNADNSYAVGNNSTIKEGADDSFIFGNKRIVNAAAGGSVVLGSAAEETATNVKNSVVLGNDANVELADYESVALGSGAKADRLGGYGKTGANDITVGNLTFSSNAFAGTGSDVAGTVSVGSARKTRTLTYVGAGEISAKSTDAINGSQLYSAIEAMQFDIVAGDNVEVVKDKQNGKTVYTIHSLNAIVKAGDSGNVTVNDNPGKGETTNGKTTDKTGNTAGTTSPTASTEPITPKGDNNHTTTYTVDAKNTTYTMTSETTEDKGEGTTTTITLKPSDGDAQTVTFTDTNTHTSVVDDGKGYVTVERTDKEVTAKEGPEYKVSLDVDKLKEDIGGTDTRNTVKEGDRIRIKEKANQDGSTEYTINGADVIEGDNMKVTYNEKANEFKVATKSDVKFDNVEVTNEFKAGDTTINRGGITTNNVTVGDTTINNDGITIKNGGPDGDIVINKNKVDMGGNRITNVAPGEDGTDAVNVDQLNAAMNQTGDVINRLGDQISKVDSRMKKGIAGAAALAALHPLDFDPDDKWEFSAGVGNYRGETAAAIGAFYHPNDDTIFSLGATVGNGENLVNGGVTFRFGQQNHQSRSKKAMAKEIVELRAEVAELKAMVYSMANGRMPGLDLTKSEEFPDTPENHWAYDYVSVLAGNGVLEGYQDGFFKGDRTLTRYEMAAIIYRAMMRGVDVDERMKEEFAPELARVKVDTLTSHSDGTPSIQRVRVIKGRE